MQILYFLITLLIQINQIDVCPGVLILFPLYKKKYRSTSGRHHTSQTTSKCLTGLWWQLVDRNVAPNIKVNSKTSSTWQHLTVRSHFISFEHLQQESYLTQQLQPQHVQLFHLNIFFVNKQMKKLPQIKKFQRQKTVKVTVS